MTNMGSSLILTNIVGFYPWCRKTWETLRRWIDGYHFNNTYAAVERIQQNILTKFALLNHKLRPQRPYLNKLETILYFKRLGSRTFHDLLNHYLRFFSKYNEYCKTEAYAIWVNFLSDDHLIIFLNIKCQWYFIMEKKLIPQLWGCHDLYGRRGIRAQNNSDSLCGVFNSDRNQIKSRSLHKRKPPTFETRFYWNCGYHKGT